MKKFSKIIFTIFAILNTANFIVAKTVDGFSYKISESLSGFTLSTDQIGIKSSLAFPKLQNENKSDRQWKHVSRVSLPKQLAGSNGIVIIDKFENGTLRLTREFWISSDNKETATRQIITNLSVEAIHLKNLFPISLEGIEGLEFKNQKNANKWNVLYQERLKNGHPSSIVPSKNDTIIIDPFVVFHANNDKTPDLLIGFLSQMDHLAQFNLQFKKSGEKVDFSSLTAECEFDAVLIPAGGERISQWIYIKSGFDPNELIIGFADKIGVYHSVKEPDDPAPSVFCTWYFHGRNYNEKYLMDDIESLKNNYMPFDVFLIDDCWANGNWGYWTPGDAFPKGMKPITETIREAGYKPGIWTAPYSVDMQSDLAKEHPEWLLRTIDDSLVVFGYSVKAWILDPTYPGVVEHLENVYRRLADDYGFSYFKFDFMRSVFIYDNVKFYDPYKTRLEAYRMGLEAIRRGVGTDAYISVCGGHYGGSLGIANSQRSGSDVVSMWETKQTIAFRQNILRTWMSRLWHVDPDALMIRKREIPYHDPNNTHAKLSLGKLTDDEALTFTLNQYVGGGMVCFSEYLKELQPERRELYRHIIPSINTPSRPLDIYNTFCPTKMLTEVKPICKSLAPWNTIVISNWHDEDKEFQVSLNEDVTGNLKTERFIVSEFFSQKILGIYSKTEIIKLGTVPAHHSRLLRIAPWTGKSPVLAGTDLHFSGGGVEIDEWNVHQNNVTGKIKTDWYCPVNLSVAFPAGSPEKFVVKTVTLTPGQNVFYVSDN